MPLVSVPQLFEHLGKDADEIFGYLWENPNIVGGSIEAMFSVILDIVSKILFNGLVYSLVPFELVIMGFQAIPYGKIWHCFSHGLRRVEHWIAKAFKIQSSTPSHLAKEYLDYVFSWRVAAFAAISAALTYAVLNLPAEYTVLFFASFIAL